MKKLLALLAFIPLVALAWQPTKPITVIFPNGPGAGNEISFFFVADIVNKKQGQLLQENIVQAQTET